MLIVILLNLMMAIAPMSVSASNPAASPAVAARARQANPLDMHHTRWTTKDGAPPNIIAMSQGKDGWLWLASTDGLFRFDGVRFERFRPAGTQQISTNVWGMHQLKSGALWIGYRTGGASLIENGTVRNFGNEDGFPDATVYDFAEDLIGRIWVATSRGLRVFDGKKWTIPADHFHAPTVDCTFLTTENSSVWAQCATGSFKLDLARASFTQVPGPVGMGRLVQDLKQTIWSVGGPQGEIVALNNDGMADKKKNWPKPRLSGGTMLFDRDSEHLWITRDDGLIRTDSKGKNEAFGVAQGLSGAMPNYLLQDREGNIWVGTENGLDRFRRNAISGVALPQIFLDRPAIAAGENGGLWLRKTLLLKPDLESFANIPTETEKETVASIWRERPDSVWYATRTGLTHQRGTISEKIDLPPEIQSPDIRSIAIDSESSLWISSRGVGTFRLKDGKWEVGGGFPDLKKSTYCIYRDKTGRLWFSFMGRRMAMLNKGKLQLYGAQDGLKVGNVTQFYGHGDDMWAGGENGLFHFDGNTFNPVIGDGDESFLGISGMFEHQGSLWLNGMAGITTIDMAELKMASKYPQYHVQFKRLDHRDGLLGSANQSYPVPSAIAGTDGTLWFTTTAGVFWLNGAQVSKNTLPPPVSIRSITTPNSSMPFIENALLRLAPRPSRLEIAYTALSLTMPERMRFRYQLENVDSDWQDAGSSRTATYTDLGPGEYRFKVIAANNDGVWNTEGAAVRFYIEPAFYQTYWFRTLITIIILAALFGLYKWRRAQIASQIYSRIEERLMERERISRELHDTILQTVHALVLQMHVATQKLPAAEPGREAMERALDLATNTISEGRDRIRGLRSRTEDQLDLLAVLREKVNAEQLGTAELATQNSGEIRRLHPVIFEEVLAIICEAIRNAYQHSGASQIEVQMNYGPDGITVIVQDNGRGIPQEIANAGHRAGHWGMIGMQERAKRIGGELSLKSSGTAGTRWIFSLCPELAYDGYVS
ncbi:two-component regulator propeller domain-containing protein [Undibacterium sp. Di26W]|uniref:sensor histidine kinase n=1 Tax=Undibacterium sp. Di26W TaxID=3413035 RepID=UPI003BF34ED1